MYGADYWGGSSDDEPDLPAAFWAEQARRDREWNSRYRRRRRIMPKRQRASAQSEGRKRRKLGVSYTRRRSVLQAVSKLARSVRVLKRQNQTQKVKGLYTWSRDDNLSANLTQYQLGQFSTGNWIPRFGSVGFNDIGAKVLVIHSYELRCTVYANNEEELINYRVCLLKAKSTLPDDRYDGSFGGAGHSTLSSSVDYQAIKGQYMINTELWTVLKDKNLSTYAPSGNWAVASTGGTRYQYSWVWRIKGPGPLKALPNHEEHPWSAQLVTPRPKDNYLLCCFNDNNVDDMEYPAFKFLATARVSFMQ